MKRQTKTYFRSLYLTLVIMMCLAFGWVGVSAAYENTVQIAYGEYKSAIEITREKIRVLDFEITLKS